ncbi:MAG: NAD(P)-binding domain-containing protein [Dehalococcoidia bacterium]|nr:NAD(P)-binding domain-containing protein [Dehalococcoidia bacterium]
MHPRIGFAGFGEVGFCMGKGFKAEGIPQVLAYSNGATNRPPYTPAFRKKAADAGVELVDTLEKLVGRSDVIFSVVVPSNALAVAREAAAYIQERHFYVDMNSCSPAIKQEAAALIQPSGATYVDGIIARDQGEQSGMLHVTVALHRVHILMASEGGEAFKRLMDPYRMDIVLTGGGPGTVAMAKMIRSILTKGRRALLWEAAIAAWKSGVDVEALQKDVFPPFEVNLPKFLQQVPHIESFWSVLHNARRSQEALEVAETLKSLGVEPIMAIAASARLDWTKGFNMEKAFPDSPPADYRELLEAIEAQLAK